MHIFLSPNALHKDSKVATSLTVFSPWHCLAPSKSRGSRLVSTLIIIRYDPSYGIVSLYFMVQIKIKLIWRHSDSVAGKISRELLSEGRSKNLCSQWIGSLKATLKIRIERVCQRSIKLNISHLLKVLQCFRSVQIEKLFYTTIESYHQNSTIRN